MVEWTPIGEVEWVMADESRLNEPVDRKPLAQWTLSYPNKGILVFSFRWLFDAFLTSFAPSEETLRGLERDPSFLIIIQVGTAWPFGRLGASRGCGVRGSQLVGWR